MRGGAAAAVGPSSLRISRSLQHSAAARGQHHLRVTRHGRSPQRPGRPRRVVRGCPSDSQDCRQGGAKLRGRSIQPPVPGLRARLVVARGRVLPVLVVARGPRPRAPAAAGVHRQEHE